MPLVQITDLNIRRGTDGKYQPNLRSEAGERQYCFLLDAVTGVGVGQEKGRKNHAKIPVKTLKPRLPSERFTKRCLNPLLATEQIHRQPFCVAPWQMDLHLQLDTSSLRKRLWLIHRISKEDVLMVGKQKTVSRFTAYFCAPLSTVMLCPLLFSAHSRPLG